MSFDERRIEVAIKLASNTKTGQPVTFAGTSGDTATLSGHRTSARIQNSGAPAGSSAHVTIWGLTRSLMDQLATLGMLYSLVPRNTITVTASDERGAPAIVFIGNIIQAWADFNSAPENPFHFECLAGAAEAVIPVPASSYTGPTDVGTIMSGLAKKMNVGFENSGVTVKLSSPYYSGSAKQQMLRVAKDAGINADLINGVLCIWPIGGARSGQAPLISVTTGMKGYPTYTQYGIVVKTIFNPNVAFGGQIKVESVLKPATGTYNIVKLDHTLDAMVPRGLWESTVYAWNPKLPKPLLTQGAR